MVIDPCSGVYGRIIKKRKRIEARLKSTLNQSSKYLDSKNISEQSY